MDWATSGNRKGSSGFYFLNTPEVFPAKFLKSVIAAHRGIANVLLRLDTGMSKTEIRIWWLMLNYRLEVQFFPWGLLPLITIDAAP